MSQRKLRDIHYQPADDVSFLGNGKSDFHAVFGVV
jgi:hypothetical protein